MANNVQGSTQPAATSKLALLVAFTAGAFAAWIIIMVSTQMSTEPEPVPAAVVTSTAARHPVAPKPKAPPKVVKPK